jgi:hypothetical protein
LIATVMRLSQSQADADIDTTIVGEEPTRPEKPLVPVSVLTQKLVERNALGQLAAIQKKDYRAALSFSAPDFQKVMTPQNFGGMITTRYPLLATAKSYSFKQATGDGDQVLLPTIAMAKNGTKTTFVYSLTRRNDTWAITNCILEPPTSSSTPARVTGVTRL